MNKGNTMKTLSFTLASLLLACGAFGADPPEKKEVQLPAPVIKAEDVMNDAVAKARTAYLKAVEAEVKRLQAVLEKEKAAATRAGSLELAMAIKAKQDALVVAEVAGKALEGAGELLGDGPKVDLMKIIVGNWNYTQGGETWQLSFNKNGTINGKKAWEETTFKVVGNVICIYTERDTLWTKFEIVDGKPVNPKDLSDCDWKKETLLVSLKK
jgi:hypothetical protein